MTDTTEAPSRALDPAVELEHLREPSPFPPGFYGTIRSRAPIFGAVGALSVLAALIPFPHHHTSEVLVAGGLFLLLSLLVLLAPWRKLPSWTWPIIPVGYIAVVAMLRDAQGGDPSGLFPLFFLPIVWLAFYGKRWQILVGIMAFFLAIVIPVVAIGGPAYPRSEWRLIVVATPVALLVAFSFLAMVGRDRRYVSDMAEQSRLASESALAAVAAREQLDSLLRAATETAVVGADAEGTVTFFSVGAERMLGYQAEEVVGAANLTQFLDAGEIADRAARLGLAPGVGVVAGSVLSWAGEESIWTYHRRDGSTRRAAITVTTQRDGEVRNGYVMVASDVTEREQLAAERERLLAIQREVTAILVEQNNRLRELTQMKDDVVATVSHELRTPLTSIRGFVELLLDDEALSDDERARMLRIIDRNSLQLLRVAEDLLADPGGGHALRVSFVETDLARLAHDAADAMAAQCAARSIELSIVADTPVLVNGDPARLHQLLANLLSNALKFAPAGGHVQVRVDATDQLARIRVLDDGPGIPPDERSQLFERFYRLASSESEGIPGSGLGLAIAKAVVDAHEGSVAVVDTPGWATTFQVSLPLVAARQPAARVSA